VQRPPTNSSGAVRIAVLVNPAYVQNTETTLRDAEVAARAMKLETQVVRASTRQEIDAAFATFTRERPDALFVGGDRFFTSRRVQLVTLATRHAIPTAFLNREVAEIGGLMSYGANVGDAWRQAGELVSRILKGAKPADMPVQQSNKFEFVINAQTARVLGINVPQSMLVAADNVIE
jgi:putative ABC transport system substrate-binding protein